MNQIQSNSETKPCGPLSSLSDPPQKIIKIFSRSNRWWQILIENKTLQLNGTAVWLYEGNFPCALEWRWWLLDNAFLNIGTLMSKHLFQPCLISCLFPLAHTFWSNVYWHLRVRTCRHTVSCHHNQFGNSGPVKSKVGSSKIHKLVGRNSRGEGDTDLMSGRINLGRDIPFKDFCQSVPITEVNFYSQFRQNIKSTSLL